MDYDWVIIYKIMNSSRIGGILHLLYIHLKRLLIEDQL